MKSLFVTLLSGIMIYAGYVYHPIIHRVGNSISEKFQTEFVPVEEITNKNEISQRSAPSPVSTSSDNQNLKGDENPQFDETESTTTDDSSQDEKETDNETSSQFNSDVGKQKAPPKTDQYYRPIPTYKPKPQPKTLPPRFDLLTSIKKGMDVSNPSVYFISDRDRELGAKIMKLEAERDTQKALTMEEIKQLKVKFDEDFENLARQYGLSAQQLTKFQGIIRTKL